MAARIVELILTIAVELLELLPDGEQEAAAHTVGVRLQKRMALRRHAQARRDKR